MTAPRIIHAQVLSHRLEVPLRALESLPDDVGALSVEVKAGHDDLTLQAVEGRSRLRFTRVGPRARLAEVVLVEDERGVFFQRVLGPLMVRFRGDLVIRLTWNTRERNSHGAYAEVTIRRGETTYPGLVMLRNVLVPATLDGNPEPLFPEREDAVPETLTPEEQEIERLLARARSQWAEYQKLRDAREDAPEK